MILQRLQGFCSVVFNILRIIVSFLYFVIILLRVGLYKMLAGNNINVLLFVIAMKGKSWAFLICEYFHFSFYSFFFCGWRELDLVNRRFCIFFYLVPLTTLRTHVCKFRHSWCQINIINISSSKPVLEQFLNNFTFFNHFCRKKLSLNY